MKKIPQIILVLLALLLMLSIVSCSESEGGKNPTSEPPSESLSESPPSTSTPEDSGPVAVEVTDIDVPAFSLYVNGVEITQDTVAEYPMYSVQAKSVNSSGTESIVTYVGFAIKDILKAAGLTENYAWLEATAGDGYAVTLTGGVIYEDTTLLAMTKDGSPFSASPWLAPCSETVTGNYLKGTVSILVSTSENAPDITNPDGTETVTE